MTDDQDRRTRILIEDLTSLLGRLSHAVLSRPSNYVLHSDIAKQASDFLHRKRKSGELPEQNILRLQAEQPHGDADGGKRQEEQ